MGSIPATQRRGDGYGEELPAGRASPSDAREGGGGVEGLGVSLVSLSPLLYRQGGCSHFNSQVKTPLSLKRW